MSLLSSVCGALVVLEGSKLPGGSVFDGGGVGVAPGPRDPVAVHAVDLEVAAGRVLRRVGRAVGVAFRPGVSPVVMCRVLLGRDGVCDVVDSSEVLSYQLSKLYSAVVSFIPGGKCDVGEVGFLSAANCVKLLARRGVMVSESDVWDSVAVHESPAGCVFNVAEVARVLAK